MAWRTAKSLDVLLGQVNGMYPSRSKVSDGSIGDDAHASRSSDHNPWYGPGIVTARDFTHDPVGGIDGHKFSAWLVASGDRRIKYIIWNRRIWEPGIGWQPYHGENPHTHHVHLSVVASPLCDNTAPWKLGNSTIVPSTLKRGMKGAAVDRLQRLIRRRLDPAHRKGLPSLDYDGVYGNVTARWVKAFGQQVGINNSEQYGPRTKFHLDPKFVKMGSTGDDVARAQHALEVRTGINLKVKGKYDGVFGSNTRHAVVVFQNKVGIHGGNGEIGSRTWDALMYGDYPAGK